MRSRRASATSASRCRTWTPRWRWFDENQVPFVKRPDQGKMRDVAFIKDPDGYWIEIVEAGRLKNLGRPGAAP